MNIGHQIPCTRYEAEGEQPRVREALAYAVGLSGGQLCENDIIGLCDTKGVLEIIWAYEGARARFGHFIEQAWIEWANEVRCCHMILDRYCIGQIELPN